MRVMFQNYSIFSGSYNIMAMLLNYELCVNASCYCCHRLHSHKIKRVFTFIVLVKYDIDDVTVTQP